MTHRGVEDGTKDGFGRIFIFQGANGLDQGAKVVFFNFESAMAPLAPEDIRPGRSRRGGGTRGRGPRA